MSFGTVHVRRWAAAAVALALAGAETAVFALRDPGIAADSADGYYANDCCGTLVLRDGHMVLAKPGPLITSWARTLKAPSHFRRPM